MDANGVEWFTNSIQASFMLLFTGIAGIILTVVKKKAKILPKDIDKPSEEPTTSTALKKIITQAKRDCGTCSEHSDMKLDTKVQKELIAVMRDERVEMRESITKIFDRLNDMNTFVVQVAQDVAFLRGRDTL